MLLVSVLIRMFVPMLKLNLPQPRSCSYPTTANLNSLRNEMCSDVHVLHLSRSNTLVKSISLTS